MDTITHTLFGVILYRAMNKEQMSEQLKRSVLFTALAGSQIPDIDVVSQLWDTAGLYQMWHRGLTHSVLLVPVWALILSLVCWVLWRTKDKRIFYLGMLAVFIHDTSDLFNAWGTGYFEPFSTMRITFGTIPIIDLAVWGIILLGFLVARLKNSRPPHVIFKAVWCLIAVHFFLQSLQGYAIYHSVEDRYEKVALSADFLPWNFKVIGQTGDVVEISDAAVWHEPQLLHQLKSASNANLDTLFEQNPKARTLQQWSPFVVIVDDQERTGLYDPRFYQNGQSFLFEYIEKKQQQ